MSIYDFLKQVNWDLILSLIAICISVYALYTSNKLQKQNLSLSIRQKLFDVANERAAACNKVWSSEVKTKEPMPNFSTISELVITIEVMERSFSLFELRKKASILNKEDFYYIIWKQLNTELRGFIVNSKALGEYSKNQIYRLQVEGVFDKFSMHYEG